MFRRLFYRLLDGPEQPLPAQLTRLRAALADVKPPRYVEGMETPERDESKPACVHLYSDADILALSLKREAEEKRQPKNVIQITARSVRS